MLPSAGPAALSDAGAGAGPPPVRRRATLVLIAATLFLDMLVYGLVVPVVPAYSAGLGASPAVIGALFAAYAVTLLAATPVLGALSPRLGRRLPLLGGLLGLVLSTALFGAATTLPVLFIARLLQGLSAAASWTAGLALVADLTTGDQRGRAFGLSTTASAVGTLLGPPVGGVLADGFGYSAPFYAVSAAAAVVLLAGVALLGRARLPTPLVARSPAALLRDPEARVALTFVALGAGALGVLEPLMPLHLEARLGATPSAIGLYFTAATATYGLAAPLVGRLVDRGHSTGLLCGGWLLLVVMLPVLVLPTTALLQSVAMAVAGVGLAATLTPALPALAACTDRVGGDYAVAYAGYNAAYAVGIGAGSALGGPLASALDVPTAMAAVAAAVLVAGVPAALWLVRRR